MIDVNSPNRWYLYDALIEGVPEDVLVTRSCLGANWSYVEAECGMGVAMTCSGGGRAIDKAPLVGRPLREVAALSKSWNFAEATLGVAALNAWYSRRELIEPYGAVFDDMGELPEGVERRADAFAMYAEEMPGKRVTVVATSPMWSASPRPAAAFSPCSSVTAPTTSTRPTPRAST